MITWSLINAMNCRNKRQRIRAIRFTEEGTLSAYMLGYHAPSPPCWRDYEYYGATHTKLTPQENNGGILYFREYKDDDNDWVKASREWAIQNQEDPKQLNNEICEALTFCLLDPWALRVTWHDLDEEYKKRVPLEA